MAYYSGSASSMADVRSALVAACTSEGWAWNSSAEVLSAGSLFVKIQVVGGYLTLLGRTSASAGDAPNVVRMGMLNATPVTWPVVYDIFVFENEVFMVINYSVDYYQFCGFGKSTVLGLPGTGMWVMASMAHVVTADGVRISPSGGGGGAVKGGATPAPFWSTAIAFNDVQRGHKNYWVHSDLDGQGWWLAQSRDEATVGVSAAAPLVALLPSRWNSEAVLLPIRCWKHRPSQKISLTVDMLHARWTRIDNYSPGQIVSLGSDRWKVFPCYRKNTNARDGGVGIDHSGTFGWAIRYEGP